MRTRAPTKMVISAEATKCWTFLDSQPRWSQRYTRLTHVRGAGSAIRSERGHTARGGTGCLEVFVTHWTSEEATQVGRNPEGSSTIRAAGPTPKSESRTQVGRNRKWVMPSHRRRSTPSGKTAR